MNSRQYRVRFFYFKAKPLPSAIIIGLLLFTGQCALAQRQPLDSGINKQTFVYAVKDTSQLALDVYTGAATQTDSTKPCVVFIFGGAFITGRRDDRLYNKYFSTLVEHGYVVVSISYRLGLRGVKKAGIFNIKPLKNAVGMAVDDLYDATNWVLANAANYNIDTSKIILSGSSSGAITALTANFTSCNYKEAASKLPPGFRYGGVVAFSGAILSFDGKLKYKTPPAPTMLFHGTADKIVPYNKIKFFNKAFYGSSYIAKTFKAKAYPYYIYRAVGMGHEIAALPMIENLPVIIYFLDEYVKHHKTYQVDMSYKDPETKPMMLLTPRQLLKKLQQPKVSSVPLGN